MYYPLLRARQFELIALRELAAEKAIQDFICPILEPVKESLNSLELAYKTFQETGQRIYLIVNPLDGEHSGDTKHYLEYISSRLDVCSPAFHYRGNGSYIKNSIEKFSLKDCMLIGANEINPEESDFSSLVNHDEIACVNIHDPGRNRSLYRFLNKTGKRCIRLDGLFEKKERNSDFLDMPARRFSEEHLYFRDDGFSGFSDYTVLPKEFIDSGSTPRAVVIHLSYLNEKNEIWIRHFTSVTNDSIANVQGKFAEAAEKAVAFIRSENLNNSATRELDDYFNRGHYPGLGMVKKISIKNHLLIMVEYFQSTTRSQ